METLIFHQQNKTNTMADLKLIETFDGGDFVLNGRDLVLIDGFQNMPYLGMFGGNVEQSTKEFLPNEQRFDCWMNSLLMFNQPAIQMNSETERILNSTALTSAGRLRIEQAVKDDLDFIKSFGTVTIAVSIAAVDRVEILIQIQELETQETTEFVYIWDATQQELEQQNTN